ncbi:MAG: anti-sigma regulatory factor [Tissierellia bacterium]|nr:anti-sigma regulatory factor [Tissierellia bacterium]
MEKITVEIPANKKYLKTVRLMTASVASAMNFDIEKIEDLRVLVSEAVNYKKKGSLINIDFLIEDDKLTIIVKGVDRQIDEEFAQMRKIIFEELCDFVSIDKDTIRLEKKV